MLEKKKVNLGKGKIKKLRFKFKGLTPGLMKTYLIVLVFFAASWLISLPGTFTCRTEWKEGSIAHEDSYAPADFWVVDLKATKAARDKKISEFYRPVCDFNAQIRGQTLKKIFEIIEKKEISRPEKEEIKSYLDDNYPQYILAADFRASLLKAGQKDIWMRTDKAGKEELKVDKITAPDRVKKAFLPYLGKNLSFTAKDTAFIEKTFLPTLTYNSRESEYFRDELAKSVPPEEKFIARGENIVRKGEKITAAQMRTLSTLNKLLDRANLKRRTFGLGLLVLMILAVISVFLYKMPNEFKLLNQHLGVVGIVAVGLLLLAKYFLNWFPPIFIPVAAGAMLIALLLSVPLAIAFAFFIAVLTGSLAGGEFSLFVTFFLGALAGILAVRHIRQRLDLFRAIILIGLVNMGAVVSFGLIKDLNFVEIGRQIIWGWGNGFLCVAITAGISPIFESLFKITSDINLLELSDLNRPILRKLMIEASGTYHHSLIVGSLAEAAAERINANSLLARVGSYYHDIGKLYKAEYFSENQAESKSRHEKLTPRMSSLVIGAHVKEGVVLARENKLPLILIDFIEQHHGTTLMWIFYQDALEKKGADEIKEDDFRYSGPKPQKREIAIVMLADAVEAASRTLEEPTPARIRGLVKQIINDKFLDAQLEECNLRLRDLHEIGESFIHTLTGLFHVRVEYPQNGKTNNAHRTKKKNGPNSIPLGKKNRPGGSKKAEI